MYTFSEASSRSFHLSAKRQAGLRDWRRRRGVNFLRTCILIIRYCELIIFQLSNSLGNSVGKSRGKCGRTRKKVLGDMDVTNEVDYNILMNGLALVLLLCLLAISNQARFHSLSQHSLPFSSTVRVTLTSTRQIVQLADTSIISLLNVADGHQMFDHTGGQSCLELIFCYYQFPSSPSPYREDHLTNALDFDDDNFTSPENLLRAAQRKLDSESDPSRRNAFALTMQEQMTANRLENLLDAEIPVILLITKLNSKRGSYVVAIGYDRNNYYFQDPEQISSIAYIPRSLLESQWQAYIASEKRTVSQVGIIVTLSGRQRELVPKVRPLP